MEIWCLSMTPVQPRIPWRSQTTTVQPIGSPPTGSGNASERGGWFPLAERDKETARRTLPQSSGLLFSNKQSHYGKNACFIRPAATAIMLSNMTDRVEWTFSKRCLQIIFLFALPHCGITRCTRKLSSFLAFQVCVGFDIEIFLTEFSYLWFLNFLMSLTNADTHFLSIFFKEVNKCNDFDDFIIIQCHSSFLTRMFVWSMLLGTGRVINNTIATAMRHDCGMNNCVE